MGGAQSADRDSPRAGERELAELVARVVDEPARRGELVAALREDSAFHAQKGRTATARMRGWLLAALERVGLPDDAIPFVLEELDTGVEPYVVAAAARAVRGRAPAEPRFARPLARAIANLKLSDEPVSFARYGVYASGGDGTALGELAATLLWMGSAAWPARDDINALARSAELSRAIRSQLARCVEAIDAAPRGRDACCDTSWPRELDAPIEAPGATVRSIELEDQAGRCATFADVFGARPTIVVLFYTRCDNPRKCSLNVTRLARVQAMLAREGLLDAIATAAITYDPSFDLPPRLAAYGRARGFIDHPHHRLLRARTGNDALIRHWRLGVGFLGALVNRHRVECLVLDREGRVRRSFPRTQWEEHEVVGAAKELLATSASPEAPRRRVEGLRAAGSIGASLLTALFPKCALCWTAYASMLGVTSVARMLYTPWLLVVFAAAVIANLASLWVRARRARAFGGFALSALGTVALLVGGVAFDVRAASWAGVALVIAGSLTGARAPLAPRAVSTA